MKGCLSFYWQWLRRAAWRAPDIADMYTTLFGFLVGAVAWLMGYEIVIHAPLWAQGLMVFILVFIIRLAMAPCWLWREERERADSERKRAQENHERMRRELPYANINAMARYEHTTTTLEQRAALISQLLKQYQRMRDQSIGQQKNKNQSPNYKDIFNISELIFGQIAKLAPEPPFMPPNGLKLLLDWNHYLVIFRAPMKFPPKVTIIDAPINSYPTSKNITNISCEVIFSYEELVEEFEIQLESDI